MNSVAVITLDTDTYVEEINEKYSDCEKIEIIAKTYEKGFNRVFELFEKNDIKATIFLISSHLNFLDTKIFSKIINKHEIADHSYFHNRLMFNKSKEEIYNEIKISKETIYKRLNIIPKGFRSPGGNISRNLIEVIRKEYIYDSSIINSFLYNFVKRLLFGYRFNSFYPKDVSKLLNKSFEIDGVLELPITNFKYLGLPTFSFFSVKLQKMRIECIKTVKNFGFLNYVIHLHEFVDKNDFTIKIRTGFMTFLNMKVRDKMAYLNKELMFIKNNFLVKSCEELANIFKEGGKL